MTPNPSLTPILDRLAGGGDLSTTDASAALAEIMGGRASEAETAAFLIGLRAKGETTAEVAGLARTMREFAERVEVDREGLVDTAGTGGGRPSFNVSTTAAFVAAAAGCPVAKHGNRSATGRCGSADVLEALGARIDLDPAAVAECIEEVGFGFMFAQRHHPAMRHVAPVRAALAIRTIFNLLGPLTNPAGASRQLLGVADPALVDVVGGALAEIGLEHGLVVCGDGGFDEISASGPTRAIEVRSGATEEMTLDPRELGVEPVDPEAFQAGSPEENAAITREVLGGSDGPERSVTLVNAGAAIYVGGLAQTIAEGVAAAAEAIDSGAAADVLERFVAATGRLAPVGATRVSRLDELVEAAGEGVVRRKAARPAAEVEAAAAAAPEPRPFAEALARSGTSLVAEHKRRSPSAGVIRDDLTIEDVLGAYEVGGAAALSILTEETSFGGSLADLEVARRVSALPILRKDFIVDRYQLVESRAAGADAILLIVAALEQTALAELHAEAHALDLDVLVEIHSEGELERALAVEADMIGINNRDLATFTVDLRTTFELLPEVPAGVTVVSESGISTRSDVEELESVGVDAVLVGEALMRSSDLEAAVRELARPPEPEG